MNEKENTEAGGEEPKVVRGAPDIAHPDDKEKYERQLAFIYAWFFEMLDRVEGNDGKAAHHARAELQTLFLNTLGQLLRWALNENDTAQKKWAGELPAIIGVNIGKHDQKLIETNPAYCDEKKKLSKFRMFPKLIRATVQRELRKAERYRETLFLLKAIKTWRDAARKQRIPEAYFAAVKLRAFKEESAQQWFKFLWPLIKENNPGLLSQLRKRSSRGQRIKLGDKSGAKACTPRWSSYRNEFKQALKSLAHWRSIGVLR